MRQIEITPGQVKYSDAPSKVYLSQGKLNGNESLVVGIDPGVNFGMTVINGEYAQILHGKLARQTEPGQYGIVAYNFVRNIYFKDTDSTEENGPFYGFKAVVEGAAYHAHFGQVGLEEVRFGFFLALYHLGFDVSIVPPATIRKGAFGSGKQQAMDLYPDIDHNAADSIGAALYALEVKDGKEDKI